MAEQAPTRAALETIFDECRQCGACCKHYRKILLQPEEVDRIRKLGGHVGRIKRLDGKRKEGDAGDQQTFMVHPDEKGCVFLHKVDGKYRCKIYHYRPKVCRGFKCNLADDSISQVLFKDSFLLLGLDSFGRKLER
jgi:uncharacterized protein